MKEKYKKYADIDLLITVIDIIGGILKVVKHFKTDKDETKGGNSK
jgi:hypothetical protein